MLRSRLSKRLEQKTKKNIVLNILGILLVVLLVFKFGIPILINLSLFFSGSGSKEEVVTQNQSFIAPPVLDAFPQATSSANIIISGLASKNQTINLYINSSLIDTAKTGDDGKFLFKESIAPGENTIKAKVIINGRESDYSNTIVTAFKSAPPFLNINSPTDGQSFSKDQNITSIKGLTDTDVKITVNGFWAITDSNGNFSYNLTLQSGDNKIKITAIDTAGNRNEKEIKVTYSP